MGSLKNSSPGLAMGTPGLALISKIHTRQWHNGQLIVLVSVSLQHFFLNQEGLNRLGRGIFILRYLGV